MIIFLIGADTFLVSPLIPLLSRELHMSVGQGGLLVTAYALAYAVAALVFGPLSDRVGRRKMILWGTFAFGLFSLLCGVAWNFWTLFLFRALSGFAAAATAPQVWASVGDWIPYEKRGKAVGIIAAALSVSQIIGVPAGAFIAGGLRFGCCLSLRLSSGGAHLGYIPVFIARIRPERLLIFYVLRDK